jgi:hypothetical protein
MRRFEPETLKFGTCQKRLKCSGDKTLKFGTNVLKFETVEQDT